MSTRTQRVRVPAMPSRSRPKVVASSFWIAPPVETPNTSAPNALRVFVVGVVVPPLVVGLVVPPLVVGVVAPPPVVGVVVVPPLVVVVEPPPPACLTGRVARARLASVRRQARRRAARLFADRSLPALQRQRASAEVAVCARAPDFSAELAIGPAPMAVPVAAAARASSAMAASRPSGRARRADGPEGMNGSPSAAGLSRKPETPGFAAPPRDGCAFVGSAPGSRARFAHAWTRP